MTKVPGNQEEACDDCADEQTIEKEQRHPSSVAGSGINRPVKSSPLTAGKRRSTPSPGGAVPARGSSVFLFRDRPGPDPQLLPYEIRDLAEELLEETEHHFDLCRQPFALCDLNGASLSDRETFRRGAQ